MNLENKKILVTGTSGLIGSNLVERLKTIPGVKVSCTVHENNWIKQREHSPQVSYVSGDLLDTTFCNNITSGVDVVFHCAARSYGAQVMENNPTLLLRDNIIMNMNILEACHKNDIKKFVWLASTTGYPNTSKPVTEDMMFQDEPFEKYYVVGWVKRYTEVLCKLFAEKLKKSLPCVVLRPSNIYGPNDKTDPKKSHVLPALMRKVIEKQNPIEVWGDGTDERDLLYVTDMVDAMIIAAEKVEKFDQINIGYGETYTVIQILDHIKKVANYDAPYKLIPTGPRMIPIRRVNIEKAERVLGWKPKVSFETGIALTYEWTKQKLCQENGVTGLYD